MQHLDISDQTVRCGHEVMNRLRRHCANDENEESQQQVLQAAKWNIKPLGQTQIATKYLSANRTQQFRKSSHRTKPGTEGFLQQEAHEQESNEQNHCSRMDGRHMASKKEVLCVHEACDRQPALGASRARCIETLATSERYRDIHGDWQEHTEWHNLAGFQRTAEILRDYVRKGSRLYIEGVLRTRSWDDRQTGQRRYRSEIVVNEISLLSPPPDGGSNDVEHYVSGQGFALPEFSEEPEITQEEVPY